MNLQNLHTHTTFCDGSDTPEELVKTALEKGFDSVGFSEHSYMWASDFSIKIGDKTKEYKEEINFLKQKYKDVIDIFLGLEVEMYSKVDLEGFDYLIGSVHYLMCDGDCVTFDRDINSAKNIINKYFGGSGIKFAKAYYQTLSSLYKYGNFDIIGHFDLITKYKDMETLFDISSKEYINAAIEAMEALKGKIPIFEVNTGAIARGYRKTPYPSMNIIKELKQLGFGVVITSDCHDKKFFDTGFDDAARLLRECGYKEKCILTENGFKEVAL